jgi:anthranilate phosphoribosyltransferase
VTSHNLDPEKLGLAKVEISQLLGGDAKQNALVTTKLFAGEEFGNSKAIADVVCLNAAAGIVAYELAKDSTLAATDLTERFIIALGKTQQALASGAAKRKLDTWTAATQSAN